MISTSFDIMKPKVSKLTNFAAVVNKLTNFSADVN